MTKEQLIENIYEIISNHIDELKYEDGANIYLTNENEIYIKLNDNEQVFVLSMYI